jgi:hypothetical protein
MNSDSFDKDFCLQKIDSAISMVDRLIDGDYPHLDSKEALTRIRDVYRKDRDLLISVDPSAAQDTVLEYCRRVNINLVRFKAFLGLLLRSSNIRVIDIRMLHQLFAPGQRSLSRTSIRLTSQSTCFSPSIINQSAPKETAIILAPSTWCFRALYTVGRRSLRHLRTPRRRRATEWNRVLTYDHANGDSSTGSGSPRLDVQISPCRPPAG